jgi:hypothetical protein
LATFAAESFLEGDGLGLGDEEFCDWVVDVGAGEGANKGISGIEERGVSVVDEESTLSPKAVILAWAGSNQKNETNPANSKILICFEEMSIMLQKPRFFQL